MINERLLIFYLTTPALLKSTSIFYIESGLGRSGLRCAWSGFLGFAILGCYQASLKQVREHSTNRVDSTQPQKQTWFSLRSTVQWKQNDEISTVIFRSYDQLAIIISLFNSRIATHMFFSRVSAIVNQISTRTKMFSFQKVSSVCESSLRRTLTWVLEWPCQKNPAYITYI